MGTAVLSLQCETSENVDLSFPLAHWTFFVFHFGFFATYVITHFFLDESYDCILTDDGIVKDDRHVWCGTVVNEKDVNTFLDIITV